MPKTNITSATISAQLKTGMIAAGNYPLAVDLQTFYDVGNKIWCIIGTAETGQIRCVGDTPDLFDLFEQNDPGVLTVQYLADETSQEYAIAPIRLNGTTPVLSGFTGIRMHTARYSAGDSEGFNRGIITVRHKTTKNVFLAMAAGRSQTSCAAITVPAGHMGYVVRLFADMYHNSDVFLDGGLWIREKGDSPRMRRWLSFSRNRGFSERIFGGIEVLEGGDVSIRITGATGQAEGVQVTAGFDIVFVKM